MRNTLSGNCKNLLLERKKSKNRFIENTIEVDSLVQNGYDARIAVSVLSEALPTEVADALMPR